MGLKTLVQEEPGTLKGRIIGEAGVWRGVQVSNEVEGAIKCYWIYPFYKDV